MPRYTGSALLFATLLFLPQTPVFAQNAPSRIVQAIDERVSGTLPGNTHPLARSEFDAGAAPSSLALDRMLLVLKRSASQEAAAASLIGNLHDKKSSQYHRWLTPQQFGQQFGVSEADLSTITSWLQSHGFTIRHISKGRNIIEFSGNAGQVQSAFHTEIHKYVVNGKSHWANASNPQIPAALTPVIAGVSTLHNFRKAPQSILATNKIEAKITAGARPQFTISPGTYALAPADFATIYNVNPVYQSGVNGAGVNIAVVARTNIHINDINSFRSAFGLSNNPPQIVVNGTDPGDTGDGDEAEAVLDTSWSGAVAPNATVKLVVSASTDATDGVDLSEEYIIDNNLADVMTESYGDCEANYTQAEADFYSTLAQQAAAQGITYTVASGDSGAEGCDDPSSEITASGPLSVNVLASTPYTVAVGGTQFNENGNYNTYWNTSNDSANASALSYIPENAWNESCTVASCGSSNAGIYAGSGGVSVLFAKPAWQTGVAGIPADGARDVPDVSMTSASHDFYLLCLDGSCTERHGQSFFSGISGTSAATPSFAGIMALIVQQTGARQGQANYTLYRLAAGESLSLCNASSTAGLPASNCIYNDVTVGNDAVPGEVGYGTATVAYQAGVGYDLATGLGSVNVTNLVNAWSGGVTLPQVRIGIDSPSTANSTVLGVVLFSGWALSDSGSITSVALAIDSVAIGTAAYGSPRPDVCAFYSGRIGCPNVGWTFSFDASLIADGAHTFDVTAVSSSGQVYTSSSSFTVANWTTTNPMKIDFDTPNAQSAPFSGSVNFGGWAFNSQSVISQVAIAIDGISFGNANYGGNRSDVCAVFTNEPGCPNVGWNFFLDTTQLADGAHIIALTPTTKGGQSSTATQSFVVANATGSPLKVQIDAPNANSPVFSGPAAFGGWAFDNNVAVSSISATIDGVPYAAPVYGGIRTDVCAIYPGRPGCPNVGWNLVVDTTQFVNGTHTLNITAVASDGQHLTKSSTFAVSNTPASSPIALHIDQPGPQSNVLLGANTFSGWALDTAGPITGVVVYIDNVLYGTATYGSSRSDVCHVYPSGVNCPNVGWSLSVATTLIPDGTHTLTVTASAASGTSALSASATAQFTVANWTSGDPMRIVIDSPNSSAAVSGIIGAGGWAIDSSSTLSSIAIAVDGVPFGNAAYGGARNDVCAIYASSPGCPNVGWNFALDTTLLSDGAHAIEVTGTTSGGQHATFSSGFQVANGTGNPIKISIDTPQTNQTLAQVYAIGGWALSTDGAVIGSVQILVDGILNGTASYGGSRTDVCAIFPSGGGCPAVGWNYTLDTTTFANGAHTLQVRAMTTSGKQYTASTTFDISNAP